MMKNRKTQQLPSVQGVEFPESEFSRYMKSRLVEIEQVKVEHEKKWGVDRVITLVDSEFRVKVWTQMERVWAAQSSNDVEKARAACDGMIRAFRALDNWAVAEGISPLPDIKAVEWMMDNGSVMVVVQTEADAVEYQRARPDIESLHIWSMSEISKMMESGIGADVARLKATLGMPAVVVKADSGFDDFENDLDINEPDKSPKMFNAKMEKINSKEIDI